jgi:hypothetical protein
LAQCNELPGTNDTYTANCGGTSYNPFNPGDSLCCGMNKFEAYVASAKSFVSTNWDSLKTLQCSNSLQDSDKNWTIYYIASLKYNGAFPSGGNLTGFINLKNADNGSCVDESVNYIYFLNTYHPDTLYASKVMENFISAVKACDSGCITT